MVTLDKEPRANQQHYGQAQFQGHQCAPDMNTNQAAAVRTRRLLKRSQDLPIVRCQRRQNPRHKAAEQDNTQDKKKHRSVQVNLIRARKVLAHGNEPSSRCKREQQSQHTTGSA
jgi:hypothetical protein